MGKKILFVASGRGHIMSFHCPYLKALTESGYTVHGAWSGAADAVPGVDKVHILPFEKKMTTPGNFRAAYILRKIIKKEGYDAIIVHTSLAAFFTRLAVLAMKKRPAVVNMVHGYLFDDQSSPLKKKVLLAAEKLTASVTDLLITMNEWDRQLAERETLGTKIAHVPGIGVDFARLDRQKAADGAELRSRLGIDESAFVLIYPAEFSARKSQSVLLRAVAEMNDNTVLILPGSGILLGECKDLAEELGIGRRVIFPGYVSDMGAWYQIADAAISASRSEGLPFNIMEAMHSGLPVVASAVKGHEDLMDHMESGLLYPYGDHKACAECIRFLKENPADAARMAEQGRENVEQYELERVMPQVMALYESVLEKETVTAK